MTIWSKCERRGLGKDVLVSIWSTSETRRPEYSSRRCSKKWHSTKRWCASSRDEQPKRQSLDPSGNERHKTGSWGADQNARKVEQLQNKTKRRVCKDAEGADASRKRVEKVYVGERKRYGRRSGEARSDWNTVFEER